MVLNVLDPYPKGWANPVTLRASAALAAAWDAAPTEQNIAGARGATIAFTYTRGGAAGAFDWQIEMSIYSVAANVPANASEWVTESIYASGAVAAGVLTQSRMQREYQTYQPTGAALEDFVGHTLDLIYPVERIRIRARESGNVGAPGTLQIAAEFW